MIQPGRLRHRVRLEQRVQAADAGVGLISSFTPIADVWAEVKPVRGALYAEGLQLVERPTHQVMMRHRPVQDFDHVALGTRRFRVRDVQEDGRRIAITLMVEELQPEQLPETLTMAFLGDSVTAAISAVSVGADGFPTVSYRYTGFGIWFMMLTGGRVLFDQGDNFGVAGDRSDQALARLDAAVARGRDLFGIHIGHNDFTQLASFYGGDLALLKSTLLGNIATMVSAARAAGQVPFIQPIWPHANWTTDAQFRGCAEHVAELKAWCAAQKVACIDGYLRDLIDPVTGYVRTDVTDGVHPDSAGAYLFGRPGAEWVSRRLRTISHKATPLGTSVRPALLALPGEAGTVSTPFAGVLADDFATMSAPTVTGGTITLSKAARDDGNAEQVITWDGVTGSSSSTATQHGIRVRLSVPEVAVGELIFATCRARFTPGSAGLLVPFLAIYEFNGGAEGPRTGTLRVGPTWPAELGGADVTLRSPPMQVRPGTGGYVEFRVGAEVLETAGVSGSMAIWAAEVLRLPAPPAPPPPDPIPVDWSLDANYGASGAATIEWTITADYSADTYDLVTTPTIPGSYTLN